MFELTSNDAAEFDEFGYSIAVDGGLALVGCEDDDDGGPSSGSGYLFDAATGTQLRKFVANDATAEDATGYSAALDASAGAGGLALLGAPTWRRNGDRTGAAYLFNATTGSQVARLRASDAFQGDEFGISVAVDGGLALVGARRENSIKEDSGSAYVFDTTTGQQLRKLKANDAGLNDQFGTSVALDGNLAVVGAYLDDGGLGSAYLFDVTTGIQLRKLIPNDALGRGQFGVSVAVDNGIVLVGARGSRPDGVSTGVAYLFDAATGNQLAELYANDGASSDEFGTSVALGNGLALIGSHADDDRGAQSGSAYLFDVATHIQLVKFTANDGASGALFGWSVGLDASSGNELALVGARYGNKGSVTTGSAYVFNVAQVPEPSSIVAACVALCCAIVWSSQRRLPYGGLGARRSRREKSASATS